MLTAGTAVLLALPVEGADNKPKTLLVDELTVDQRIVDERMNLTVHLHHSRYQGYDESWPVELAACEMTNICLKNATAGADQTNPGYAMNLLLASEAIPDIVGSSRIKEYANQFGPMGAFTPLNDLIDDHAPHLKAFFDERPRIRASLMASDGNIYFIPNLPDGKYGRAYWIRTDWLDALDLEVPSTIEEYEAVLIAFRDQDPNGNGLQDEIPFFARHWQEFIRLVTLFGGRSTGSDDYHDFVVTSEGVIQHPYMGEGYRDGIQNLARWYKEGLVDPEIFTRGSDSRKELLSKDIGGSTHDWFASTAKFNNLADDIDGFEFRAMLPPANGDGIRFEEHRRSPVRQDGWAIGGQNKSPVETIKYFDFWFSPQGRRLANFGVEGEQYDVIDGEAVFRPDFLSRGPVNDLLYEVGAQITARGFHQDFGYEEQWLNEYALEGIALYEEGATLVDDLFLGVTLNKEEQVVNNQYWSVIRTHMQARQRAWLLGEGDVVAEWDDYLVELDKMGISMVIDALQSAYNRQ